MRHKRPSTPGQQLKSGRGDCRPVWLGSYRGLLIRAYPLPARLELLGRHQTRQIKERLAMAVARHGERTREFVTRQSQCAAPPRRSATPGAPFGDRCTAAGGECPGKGG